MVSVRKVDVSEFPELQKIANKYFSSFKTPHDAFANYISIIQDFKTKVLMENLKQKQN